MGLHQDQVGRGIAARIGASVSIALMAATAKLAYQSGASAVEVIFYRQCFSLPLIFLWVMLGPGIGSLATSRPKAHLVRGIIGIAATIAVFMAILMLPLAEATAINFVFPLFATLLAALVLKEHVGLHRWAAMAIGFAGVLLMTGSASMGNVPLAGILIALLGAFLAACVSITVRQLGSTEPPTTIVFWFATMATLVMALVMPWHARLHEPGTWGLLALLGTLGGVTQILVAMSLRWAPIGVTAPFDYIQLLWATVLGWLLWEMFPDGWTIAGAILIAGSGLYTFHREHVRRRAVAREGNPIQ